MEKVMNSRIISLTVHTTCMYLVNFTQRQMSPEPIGEKAGGVSGLQHLQETKTQFIDISTLSLSTLPTAALAPLIVYVYVCMYAFMYVCMYVCVCMDVCMCVCMRLCMCVCMCLCMDVCMCVCMCLCMYLCVFLLFIYSMLHYIM